MPCKTPTQRQKDSLLQQSMEKNTTAKVLKEKQQQREAKKSFTVSLELIFLLMLQSVLSDAKYSFDFTCNFCLTITHLLAVWRVWKPLCCLYVISTIIHQRLFAHCH